MVSVLADVYYTYCHFRVFIPHCTLHTAITHVITALEWNSSCEFQWHTSYETVPFKYWNYISDGTVCNVWVGLETKTTVFLYIRAHMVWVHPPITYVRVCVFVRVSSGSVHFDAKCTGCCWAQPSSRPWPHQPYRSQRCTTSLAAWLPWKRDGRQWRRDFDQSA